MDRRALNLPGCLGFPSEVVTVVEGGCWLFKGTSALADGDGNVFILAVAETVGAGGAVLSQGVEKEASSGAGKLFFVIGWAVASVGDKVAGSGSAGVVGWLRVF